MFILTVSTVDLVPLRRHAALRIRSSDNLPLMAIWKTISCRHRRHCHFIYGIRRRYILPE